MDNEKVLQLIPVRICEHEEKNGVLTVLFDSKSTSFLDRVFFSKLSKKPSKIDLDEIGSFIWNQIDGKTSVMEIMAIAREKFENKIEPAEERVAEFFRQMAVTKLIGLYEKK